MVGKEWEKTIIEAASLPFLSIHFLYQLRDGDSDCV
jgi:hypothetical protein